MLEAPGPYLENTTVAVVGIDGYARAKTHFTPRAIPSVPDAFVVLYPEAHVAAGLVYFVDGRGVVRTLSRNGAVRVVARFPMKQSQQLMSFAVRPDGKQIVAAILTLPALGKQDPVTGWYAPVGPWNLEVDLAPLGGSTVVLHRWRAAGEPSEPGGFPNIVIAGWDTTGPVGVVGGGVAAQDEPFDNQVFFGGHFVHLDSASGLPGATIGGCQDTMAGPWAVEGSGATLCATYASDYPRITVETTDLPAWQFTAPMGSFGSGGFALSPDANRLAMDAWVVSRTTETVPISESFVPEGWLDSRSLIGWQRDPKDPGRSLGMAYLQIPNPVRVVNLGFKGTFVGVIA